MRYLPWLPGVGSGPSTQATFVGGSFFEITKRAVVEWHKFCRREYPISVSLCHKLPFLFCSPDRNFLQFTTLSCTLLLIFLILVCFAFFFSFPFLLSGNPCRLFSCFAPSTYQNSIAGFVTFVDGAKFVF
jgi:hypothetical protein